MDIINIIILSLAGGVIPALVWLWFWLREDRLHPEPRLLIAISFLAGMLIVPLVIPIEKMARDFFGSDQRAIYIVWAAVEELAKFVTAYFVVLNRKEVDEPIDYVIYLITLALGFSAIENSLFILTPLWSGSVTSSLATGDLRAIGATLVHIVCSGTIGVFLAFSFYDSAAKKRIFLACGVILSVALHSIFNLFIINSAESGGVLMIFFGVWISVVVLLALFEKIKGVKPMLTLAGRVKK